MRFTFLGTGTSGGVPALGCHCKVCKSHDPRDRRLRTAGMLETLRTRILIDCGPDIRQQLMNRPFRSINALLLTHQHYDHIAGIDDLKPFCVFDPIDIYADDKTVACLHQTMPYCFGDHLYPGVPLLNVHTIVPHECFRIGDIEVMPFRVNHANLPIMAYRFGNLAYITDMRTIDDVDEACLAGVDTLIVNALRFKPVHCSHMIVDEAIAFARRLKVKHTYFIHMSHDIGLHEEVNNHLLPTGFSLAYDGLQIDI